VAAHREGTGKVQGRYREGTGKVQGRYREGTGKVQGRYREDTGRRGGGAQVLGEELLGEVVPRDRALEWCGLGVQHIGQVVDELGPCEDVALCRDVGELAGEAGAEQLGAYEKSARRHTSTSPRY
jgi:hypothetical protein